VFKLYR